jgi:hypothetical protein
MTRMWTILAVASAALFQFGGCAIRAAHGYDFLPNLWSTLAQALGLAT